MLFLTELKNKLPKTGWKEGGGAKFFLHSGLSKFSDRYRHLAESYSGNLKSPKCLFLSSRIADEGGGIMSISFDVTWDFTIIMHCFYNKNTKNLEKW